MIEKFNGKPRMALVTLLFCGYPFLHSAQPSGLSLDQVIENFQELVTEVPQEKVYMHTDKSIYITGETVWFKAYCVDNTSHQLSPDSKVLSVELTDKHGKSVLQTRIELTGGIGQGQLFIGPKLISGHYSLTAYTNWMRNFNHDFVFRKTLTIINPASPYREISSPGKDPLLVNFFPEGGDLVYGIESRIAVKVTDLHGRGRRVTGRLYDTDEDEVGRFNTSEKGFGSFVLRPETGKSYQASVSGEHNKEMIYDFPLARLEGYVMKVAHGGDSLFDVSVTSSGRPEEQLYLIVHSRGKLELVESRQMVDGKARFPIPRTQLLDGISQITLMNSLFHPVCERLIFEYPEASPSIQLEMDHSTYGHREKVTVSIEFEQTPLPSTVSLSVSNHPNVGQSNQNIQSYLLLTSDLKGPIEDPEYYFETANGRPAELDVLLLTHGWRRFRWDSILANNEPVFRYPPEIHSPVLGGRVNTTESLEAVESIFLGFPGKHSTLNSVEVNPDGRFYFEVPFRMKNEPAFFWAMDDSLRNEEIELISPFDITIDPVNLTAPIPSTLRDYIEHANANVQIGQAYLKQSQINGMSTSSPGILSPFYGNPNSSYILDDFTRFVEMREVFTEYIRSAVIRGRDPETTFHVVRDKVYDAPALVLLDGVPINDADFMLGFDPIKVQQIDVINDYYQIGTHGFAGILNFVTYEGDLADTPLPAHIVEKLYEGLQTPREFFSPNYAKKEQMENHLPDFRNVLLWEPDINIPDSGIVTIEFFTSDDDGEYRIQVQGVTHTGSPLYAESYFNVE